MNVCEHGDHPSPIGKRFCSDKCLKCEHESTNEYSGCDMICEGPLQRLLFASEAICNGKPINMMADLKRLRKAIEEMKKEIKWKS